MRKTLLTAALGCLAMTTAFAQEETPKMVVEIHQLAQGTALFDSLPGSYVRGVSRNGEWATGNGTEYTQWSFVWNRTSKEFKLITGAYKDHSIANGVSNDGLVVGAYKDSIIGSNGTVGCMRPGIWKDGVWTPLPIEVKEEKLVSGDDPSVNGEACYITGDGAFITGYIYSPSFERNFYDDNGNWQETKTVGLLRPAIWSRKSNGDYRLERKWGTMPTGDELQQGAWSHYGSSEDCSVIAGVADHPTGCRAPSVWVNEKLTRIYGKEDIDINIEDQYFYDGAMGSVSANGKYAGGYFDPTGTGYSLTGFVYDTETEEVEELEGWGAVTAALDDGTLYGMSGYAGSSMIRSADKSFNGPLETYLEEKYGTFSGDVPQTILSVSEDGSVLGGWYAVSDAIGLLMYPCIVEIRPQTAEEAAHMETVTKYGHSVLVIGDEVVAPTARQITLYSAQGTQLGNVSGDRISLAGQKGVVIAKATFDDGKTTIKKVTVK